ncbi:villin-1 [Tripterygium wilfordii]|uniref:villin-1 n=1 Tax=Tripterygium wilfordii TaxID=458696 RepID=UPI0018F83A56|nr:villin-1 [Tripterygium wilfordii]
MSLFGKDTDPVFQGAGAKAGLEIWCVDKHQLASVQKSFHGKFYSGSAYVVLNTVTQTNGPPQYNIHYWLGNGANKVDSALASDKALELDSALGSCAVQYREVQGQETEKFLSYFRPCIIPIEGVYSLQPGHVNGETYKVSLFTCKGDHVVSVKEVPFSRSSLNHNDVFILDTASKLFLFCGCNSSIQERAKALEVVQYISENKHSGKIDVATIEDGKFVGDPDVGEFWSLFGGYAPIPKDSPSDVQKQSDFSSVKLFWISLQGKLCQSESASFNKEMLETNKCYMLDCDTDIYIWMGRNTSLTERKTSISTAEDFIRNQGRSTKTRLTFLTEGLETTMFKSYFNTWSQKVEPRLYEEGRGKVAAIFKQQGYDVKELQEEEDCDIYINCRGKLKVWRLSDGKLLLVPVPEQTMLFSGDCYIVQYTYPADGRDENLLYVWLGRHSLMEDRVDAIACMNAIVDATKGDPVVAQVTEGREPLLFFSIFQALIIFKGVLSTQYKKFIAEKGVEDDTYDGKKTALFRVQGKNLESMQAIQVDQVSSSLNSSYCYILQTGTCIFTWIGSLSSTKDHELLDRMLELINPTWQPMSVREGSEPDTFWNALGGKTEYPREKEMKEQMEDPHLFLLVFTDGDFKVKEVYNFNQDDLTTEDAFILDCHREIYVWIGHHSNVKSKQQALSLGSKFLEADIWLERSSSEIPIYVVTEGQEPQIFTRFFEWDFSKANMHGNSFERKLAILKGNPPNLVVPVRNSWKTLSRDSTPDYPRSRSVDSTGRGSNFSSTTSVSGSNFKPSNDYLSSSLTPIGRKLFSASSSSHSSSGSPTAESSFSGNVNLVQFNGNEAGLSSLIYPYQRVKVDSKDPVTGIDVTKRETYLSDEEFQEKFSMTKQAFYELPKWRQNKLKITLHLF